MNIKAVNTMFKLDHVPSKFLNLSWQPLDTFCMLRSTAATFRFLIRLQHFRVKPIYFKINNLLLFGLTIDA